MVLHKNGITNDVIKLFLIILILSEFRHKLRNRIEDAQITDMEPS